MKVYAVGGSVRDQLLGLEVRDQDYVVVGSTPEEMRQLGFKPVGRDFPVFLHPETHEQYALARTERKSGHGYRGFTVYASPDVTLEQDLERRDLTINAIARDRIRALQLMQQSMGPADADPAKSEAAQFYLQFAGFIQQQRGANQAWRLQARARRSLDMTP